MGRVCRRVKNTEVNLKNERLKIDYSRCLGLVTVRKALVPALVNDVEKQGDNVMDFELSNGSNALSSPVRFVNAMPLRNGLCMTPKTPCKKQAGNLRGTPKTPSSPRRLCGNPRVLANLLRTPKSQCSKSRFHSPSSSLSTPETPRSLESAGESRLESLPIDILVKVLCHLHHDQLKPAFHVSKRVREAVQLARQYHFNFTTPDRSRQALLNTTTPQPWEHWPFINASSLNRNRDSMLKSCPRTPKAPRHNSRPPPKFDPTEVCPIDDALFEESAFPLRCASSSSLTRSISKSQLASNRVLFYSNDSNCCNSLL